MLIATQSSLVLDFELMLASLMEASSPAALAIDGPGGYHLDAAMDHAGDSCIYQYNWDTDGNGGAGTYSFSVTGGNGTSLSFTAELSCR
jgi:hypothetical protein